MTIDNHGCDGIIAPWRRRRGQSTVELDRCAARRLAGALFCTLATLTSVSATANTLTFNFGAAYGGPSTFGNTSNLPDLSAGLAIGQIIHGSFSYDPSLAATVNFSSPSETDVQFFPATVSFSIPSVTVTNQTEKISISDFTSANDFFNIGINLATQSNFTPPTPPANHTFTFSASLSLGALNGTTFNSSSLPTSYIFSNLVSPSLTVSESDSLAGFGAALFGTISLQFDVTEISAANTPLPATLPLFATGLGALGVLGWRRKRKLAA
jgi:hypothetical protein